MLGYGQNVVFDFWNLILSWFRFYLQTMYCQEQEITFNILHGTINRDEIKINDLHLSLRKLRVQNE